MGEAKRRLGTKIFSNTHCPYCGLQFVTGDRTNSDHVINKSAIYEPLRGGPNAIKQIRVHTECHEKKNKC